MKVIDLLNKIAKGEEVPKQVKYKIYYWKYIEEAKDYKDDEDDYVFSCSNYVIPEMLDNEVEIIEEDKEIDTTELQEKISKFQSEIDLFSNEINRYHSIIHSMRDRSDYMKESLKELQKEVNKLKRGE